MWSEISTDTINNCCIKANTLPACMVAKLHGETQKTDSVAPGTDAENEDCIEALRALKNPEDQSDGPLYMDMDTEFKSGFISRRNKKSQDTCISRPWIMLSSLCFQ